MNLFSDAKIGGFSADSKKMHQIFSELFGQTPRLWTNWGKLPKSCPLPLLFEINLLNLWHQIVKFMKKYLVSMVIAFLALVMLSGCIVSEEKLTDKVQQSMVEYEQNQGNRLEVTDLKLEKSRDKGYKGVLTGRLNGEDVTYDVTVSDAGDDFDVDWELRK